MGKKYAKQNHVASKRIAREESVEAIESNWVPPTGETYTEEQYLFKGTDIQLIQREVRLVQNQMLVEFAIVADELSNGEWHQILCIDSCHPGEIHRHIDNDHKNPKLILELKSEKDLDTGFQMAIEAGYDFIMERSGEKP